MNGKSFDAVAFMRQVRDKMSAEMEGMTFEEQKAYIEQRSAWFRKEREKGESMSSQPLRWSYNLRDSAPQVDVAGGTIKEANASTFPALNGNGLAIYLLELQPGAIRIPHWHPDAAELDYCLEGAAVISIASPTGDFVRVELTPGMISVIPQGWFHYIANNGEGPMRLLVIFNNSQPNDIGISEGFRGVPDEVLALTFGVEASRFAGIDRNVGYIAPQGPQTG